MKRKTFIKRTLSGIIAGVTGLFLFQQCAESDDVPPVSTTPDCLENGAKHSTISLNHGHTLTISKEDVMNGVAKSYIITGTASHAHEVALNEDHFAKLKNNEIVTIESSMNSSHTHQVTVKCA
ncbi:MAG TPA: hypothetical protein PKJ63_12825 [Cyclobacteriaceae bacterium]|nr:hypothetical protein [Cyclobacteriaceae bacterium]